VSLRLSKVEEWILSAMAIEHFRMKQIGEYGERIWNIAFVVDNIPQVYYDELESPNDIRNALINLINTGLAEERMHGDVSCIITENGVFAFRKFLSPLAKKMEDKKSYKKILEDTPGNPEIRKELKNLPDELKDRLAKEGVDALIKIGMRYGIESTFYLIELLQNL